MSSQLPSQGHGHQYGGDPRGRHAYQQPIPPQYAPAPPPPAPAPKKRRVWPWVVAGVVLLMIVIGSMNDKSSSSSSRAAAPSSVPFTYSAPAAAAPAAPAEVVEQEPAAAAGTVGDGTYEVGVDMEPGRYKTSGPDGSSIVPMCYWARHKDDSGEFRSIIANDNLQGPGSVTVKAGEFAEFSGGCTWTRS